MLGINQAEVHFYVHCQRLRSSFKVRLEKGTIRVYFAFAVSNV